MPEQLLNLIVQGVTPIIIVVLWLTGVLRLGKDCQREYDALNEAWEKRFNELKERMTALEADERARR